MKFFAIFFLKKAHKTHPFSISNKRMKEEATSNERIKYFNYGPQVKTALCLSSKNECGSFIFHYFSAISPKHINGKIKQSINIFTIYFQTCIRMYVYTSTDHYV